MTSDNRWKQDRQLGAGGFGAVLLFRNQVRHYTCFCICHQFDKNTHRLVWLGEMPLHANSEILKLNCVHNPANRDKHRSVNIGLWNLWCTYCIPKSKPPLAVWGPRILTTCLPSRSLLWIATNLVFWRLGLQKYGTSKKQVGVALSDFSNEVPEEHLNWSVVA